jgi:hypothetical protein
MTDSWARERADELLMSILLRSSRGQQRDALEAALREAEQRVIARLREPDEAMIEAVASLAFPHVEQAIAKIRTKNTLIALKAVLSSLQEEETDGCLCQRCGSRYKVDVMVDDELWERIKPESKPLAAGLLCGRCIFAKIETLGEFGWLRLSSPQEEG